MDKNNISADHIIATLVDMGFDITKATEAIEVVGPTLHEALEFILSRSSETNNEEFHSIICSTGQSSTPGCVPLCSSNRMKQPSIKDHLHPLGRLNNNVPHNNSAASCSSAGGMRRSNCRKLDRQHISNARVPSGLGFASEYAEQTSDNKRKNAESLTGEFCRSPSFSLCNEEVELNWEQKVGDILQKHFGFSSLKGFQRKALEAWSAKRDSLILAATGSGKSLCFQIPALLTSKVVIVVSPLISLMNDQCLNLAKRGISACFLGSGQPDCTVEHKAMCGMYKIVYVCPETILRLIEPLRRLAVNPGIALFAIDEVHCVSKWGHDFRPDYRRLSVLRDNFNSCCLKSSQFDIPLMALTATATTHVREDIIKSLHMSNETEIILTSFFRSNLRFSVKHSKTNSVSSYYKDFKELIKLYTAPRMTGRNEEKSNFKDKDDGSDGYSSDYAASVGEDTSISDDEDGNIYKRHKVNPVTNSAFPKENQLTDEYLEDELNSFHTVDDLDVSCGEFPITSPSEILKISSTSELLDAFEGPTIIYVPTRKETLKIAEFLSKSGVRAAAYHAKLVKTHLRKVHDEFHQGSIQVVVATIAFGMGIDKSNVRRIIHYGWPQSLEAYYQEAGRAGRDGKLSDCTLYANLSRIPTLLPSQRSEEQTKQAYKMLSDCFRYAMCTTSCRAKALVGYFGEDFSHDGCHLCDVCVAGPPKIQNMKAEVDAFLGVLEAGCRHAGDAFEDYIGSKMFTRSPNLRMVVSLIREKFKEFATSDRVWWQGLARILENMGYIKEADVLARVSIRFPQITEAGLGYLHSKSERIFLEYPEADMLLSAETGKPYSSFSEWGRGWADPDIRRQRLQRKRKWKKKRSSSSKQNENLKTVRGRLAAKLSKGFK